MKSKRYIPKPVLLNVLRAAAVSLIVLLLHVQVNAQTTRIIRGTVKTLEDQQPLPGANIYLKSRSSVGTFSDGKGEFEFPRLLQKGDTLVFSFLGLKTAEYAVSELPAASIVIEMEADLIQMVDDILVTDDEPAQVAISNKRVRRQKGNR